MGNRENIKILLFIFSVSLVMSLYTVGCQLQVNEQSTEVDSSASLDGSISSSGNGDTANGHSCEIADAGGADESPTTDSADHSLADTEKDSSCPTDTDVAPDEDSDTNTETASVGPCPEDMVHVATAPSKGISSSFCIDRFEASRKDATATSPGSDDSVALSRGGVLPWFKNPIDASTFAQFKNACLKNGKRICRSDEWFGACTGTGQFYYVFGDTFDPLICNCVDTFCASYCQDNDIPETECNTESNCGYDCGKVGDDVQCFHVAPTGDFPECKNGFGTYDINGNVWELVAVPDDPDGFEIRGGAFNCAGASTRLRCDYKADWTSLYAGFRCCKDPVD